MTISVLPRTGILAFMDDESREELAGYGSTQRVVPSQVIITEGAAQMHLYVVISGMFSIATRAAGRDIALDVAGEGDCFGEVAVFQEGPASATVASNGPGELWSIDVERLQHYLLECPFPACALLLGINTLLGRRLKRAHTVLRSTAVLPSFLKVRGQRRPVAGA